MNTQTVTKTILVALASGMLLVAQAAAVYARGFTGGIGGDALAGGGGCGGHFAGGCEGYGFHSKAVYRKPAPAPVTVPVSENTTPPPQTQVQPIR